MFARLLVSLVLGFIFATGGIVLFPDLGRAAGPVVCNGELALEPSRISRLGYRCIEAGSGRSRRVEVGRVITAAIPLFAALMLAPVSVVVARFERHLRAGRARMDNDLKAAVDGTARVLARAEGGLPIQRRLVRVVQLRLDLEVRSPPGRVYPIQVVWVIDYQELKRLAVGQTVPIRVNPRHPERVYPAEPWAEYVWWGEGIGN